MTPKTLELAVMISSLNVSLSAEGLKTFCPLCHRIQSLSNGTLLLLVHYTLILLCAGSYHVSSRGQLGRLFHMHLCNALTHREKEKSLITVRRCWRQTKLLLHVLAHLSPYYDRFTRVVLLYITILHTAL